MKNIQENFIPIEEAKQLHELGFRDDCLAHLIGFGDGTVVDHKYVLKEERMFINGEEPTSEDVAIDLELNPFGICRVPLFQQAFEFFREKYNMHGYIKQFKNTFEFIIHSSEFGKGTLGNIDVPDYSTYEEAQLECLRTLIKLCYNGSKRES